ncbi:hypothetical protein GQ607_008134 [Colletotrichum asianum]|uniref:Uncharacterized protein n=1 Tax=Colletotrichum asianum TaxID=702518 RepID=A0A8H3WEB3_9PEZI|nr:hypothetical protein GQ607_008134 [Colletotrichum asianum]
MSKKPRTSKACSPTNTNGPTMKFFAVAAITFASVAVAAPTLEGQTTSIKLSKDYVDAIIAAYPDVHKRDCSFDFSCGCIFCT